MNHDDWLQHLQTPVGSKRPSPSPADEDREVKKSRTQPYINGPDHNILNNELPFASYDDFSFPSQDLYHEYENEFNNGSGSQFDNFTSGEVSNVSFHSMERGQHMLANTYDSVPCTGGGLPTSNLGVSELLDRSHLELPSIAEPWPGNLPNQLTPINSFLRSSDRLDISMGNTMHGISTTSRPFEETLPLIGFSGLEGLSGSYSQGHTHTPDVLSRVDVSRNGQLVFSESPVNQPFSQIPTALLSAESMDVCCDYDTCFGVVITELTSSFALENGTHSVPVNLKPFGGIFMLQSQNSGAHVGILSNSGLVNALRQLRLKLDATVRISEIKGIRESGKPKMKKFAPATAAREYSIRIILYGLRDDKVAMGSLLSDAGFFLQHPYATEIISEVQYDNPHYLLRPGAEMPELEHLHLDIVDHSSAQTEPGNEISKSRFLKIFETAGADWGTVTAPNMSLSPRLRSPLMSHQITALAMMLEKESGYVEQPMFPSLWRKELSENSKIMYYRHTVTRSLEPRPIPAMGGILADDMGLGKTLSVLALICSSVDFDSTTISHSKNAMYQGTLIIAPKSTIYGWVDQISEHIHKEQIRVYIYHGSGRESHANQFRDADIVITTYETLRSEWAASKRTSPLYSWNWLRVVLDEAHHIRNRSKQAFQSVCELTSRYRWCLTGTPIHNSLDDYGALLSFIRVFPFVERSNFMYWIVKPVEEEHKLGVERLQGLIRATCLRRTKQKTLSSDQLKLPPRSERIHEVHLHWDDQVLYDTVRKYNAEIATCAEKQPEKDSIPKGKEKNILLLINSLRLICDHGKQLLPEAIKRRMEESSIVSIASFASEMQQVYHVRCSVCEGELDGSVAPADGQDSICVNCAISEQGSSNTNLQADFLGRKGLSASQSTSSGSAKLCHRPSAKVLALLGNLEQERSAAGANHRPRKSVVFSCWVKMLDLIEKALYEARFGVRRIDGHTSLEGRRKAVQEFNDSPDCTVMLASIGSSAEGVNLTAASIVHLIEPQWNPMVEAQAVDRVYRIGQTQEVTIIRYIVPNSVETYVQQVQQEKMQIINQAINMKGVTGADLESERWKRMKEMLA
ncbi:uncharacterized protein LY89DRAFT_616746 [Mollisia scopiformis]|uniref:Uncharacterized protein n=1 Tax=Mollisia scopiformis TaxID=149040 RepID=A0A194XA24_MOLSC|nr:uncharacterized protein LY89DRAFT_616746 [Mollisia scopiformis]KUJ17015.1 hypothetical protein LY89DRAFT_616746 [Mollisia scopiformis]